MCTERTRNESVHILRIHGKNLYVTENARNKVNILTKFRCLYTENTRNESVSHTENIRNESVRILRIRGMNLFVY
jgi:hypothetical protein